MQPSNHPTRILPEQDNSPTSCSLAENPIEPMEQNSWPLMLCPTGHKRLCVLIPEGISATTATAITAVQSEPSPSGCSGQTQSCGRRARSDPIMWEEGSQHTTISCSDVHTRPLCIPYGHGSEEEHCCDIVQEGRKDSSNETQHEDHGPHSSSGQLVCLECNKEQARVNGARKQMQLFIRDSKN